MFTRLLTLVRQAALYGIGPIAAKALAVVLLPVYTYYLRPDDYGAVETILVTDLVIAAIVRLGMQNSLMRFYAEEDRKHDAGQAVAATAVWYLVGVTALTGAILAGVAPWASELLFDTDEYANLVRLGAFGIWVSTAWQAMNAVLRVREQAKTFMWLALANVAATAVLTLTFIVALGWKAEGLLLGNFLGTAVLLPAVMWIVRDVLMTAPSRTYLRPMVRFGAPTAPMAIANQGLHMIDRVLLSRMHGLTAVGLYAVAGRYTQVILLIITSLQLSWQPFAYGIEKDDDAKQTYAMVVNYYLAVVGWIVVGVSLLAEPLLRLLTHPRYHDAAEIAPLLAIAAGMYGVYFLASAAVGRAKKTEWHVVVAVSAIAVSLGANLLLIPKWDVMGAAVAAILANLTLSALMIVRGQQVFKVPYNWLRLGKALVAMIAVTMIAYALPTTGWETNTARVVIALLYPLLLVAIGFFPRRELRAMRQRVRRRRRSRSPSDE